MTDKNFNPTSPFIPGQLPEFVRVDHPTLVSFLTAYYEWLDSDNTYLRSPKKLASVVDVDTTLEEFITYFKNEYLFGFPEKLAVSEKTSKPVDPVKLMKNIKGFYRAKGTEKTYDFLFRILFDTSVEFYYPKTDIMKLSDGKWVVRRSIKISNNIGNAIFDSVGGTVVQRNTNGDIVASARVLEVSTYRIGTNDIAELFLGGVNGEFQAGYDGVEFTDKSEITRKENRVFSVIGKTTISNGGSGYKAGDRIIFTPTAGDTGVKAAGRVAEVDASGTIRKIIIDNFGVNYKTAPTLSVQTELGSGFAGSVTVGGMAEYQGYYANNDGRLSTNKVIQDSHYYQNFSYVILSEVTIDRYRDILKRLLNPAGLAFFGKVQIKRCAFADLQNSTSLVEYEVPIIGHYTPYTFLTHDDLSKWFTDANTGLLAGYDPTIHNSIIKNDLDDSGTIDSVDVSLALITMDLKKYSDSIGNPVSFNRAFENPLVPLSTQNFQNADPFWIIYEHPNRKIRGLVTARIPYDLKNEFLNDLGGLRESPFDGTSQNSGTTGYWAEWTEGTTSNRTDWAAGFTSGERYVTLNYNPLKPYTQEFYEPRSSSGLPGSTPKFLPKIYIENIFTYEGLQAIESIIPTSDKGMPGVEPRNSPTTIYSSSKTNENYTETSDGIVKLYDDTIPSAFAPALNEFEVNNKANESNTKNLAVKSSGGSIASYNEFTSWDNVYGTFYKTTTATAHLGVAGVTNTSWGAMDKFARSLSGDIAGDWNGISGAAGYRIGNARYLPDHVGLISMNTEAWDYLIAQSDGIINPDDPNSLVNFIMRKILIPIFVGGTGADGKAFPGLRQIYPGVNWGNYGHPGCLPNYIPQYYKYPGFNPTARTSIFETLTNSQGKTYKSYKPSPTCPDCRWDGRVELDGNDPDAGKAENQLLVRAIDVRDREYAIKLHKEKWYDYCKAVQVWMPSFYIATEDLQSERDLQHLTINALVEMRKQIADELGYDDKLIIPFISNKYFTVFTGSGGFGHWGDFPSVQDSSFLTAKEFVDNYIAPSLSGQAKGAVQGFYIWTGDDTYIRKQALSITTPNPTSLDITGADGSVIGRKLNPTTIAYGWEPYWDFNGGEALRPGAPTGPNVIGLNGQPRVAWFVQGGGYGHNPWWGGNRRPEWPTAQAANGSGCQRLEVNSTLWHHRQNLLAYQAYLDGMTGQTAAQFVFDKPEKYAYLKPKFPTWFERETDNVGWSRVKGYVYRIRKTSVDGRHILPILGMTPGTTFAFNYRKEIEFVPGSSTIRISDPVASGGLGAARPVRQRDGIGVTGAMISNPLFHSLTGSSRVFSYSDGKSYTDRGWNTADRIGYIKSVRDLDANTAEVVVEPFFFVGQPIFTQESFNDQTIWDTRPHMVKSGNWQEIYLPDGITHGLTSGNGVSNIAITGPHTRHCCGGIIVPSPTQGYEPSSIIAMGAQIDPNWTGTRPKYINLGFPGDIFSFGAVGPTFELVDIVYVTGDFRRTTRGEIDTTFELVDKISETQIQAGVDYWDKLYNPVRTGDFAFEYDVSKQKWFAYGPNNKIIINGWEPQKPGTSPCSTGEIKPTISVTTDDNSGEMIIQYVYNNTCSETKYAEWPDVPPLDLGDSIDYYDTRSYGTTGSSVGVFRNLNRNNPVTSSRYPDVLYSPTHLVKTKFQGDCCENNNFAVSMTMLDLFPETYSNEVSLVVYPPQDYPAVVLTGIETDFINERNFNDKITPTETTKTSKWASAWDSPKNGGATGTTHITTMFKAVPGRISGNARFDEAITGATSAKMFLSTIPPERRAIQTFFMNGCFGDSWWLSDQGITLDNTFNTGDACRDASGNFVAQSMNDPRIVIGKTGPYGGTQRFLSPWLDNSAERAKQKFTTWLSEFSSIGGSAQYFIGDNEDSVVSHWSPYLRRNASDPTTNQQVDHLNIILADPRTNSLTAGNAGAYGSFRSQLRFDKGYTTAHFSNRSANDLIVNGLGATAGAYKRWNYVTDRLVSHYLNECWVSPITTYYPNAKISNYGYGRITETDEVTDSNGHRQYIDTTIGTAVAPFLYGEIFGVGNNAWEVFSGDNRTITYKPGTTIPFRSTPWNGFLLNQQLLRAFDRNRLTDSKELHPWIASRKFDTRGIGSSSFLFHNEYWRENVYHTLLHNPELLLYWNSSSVSSDDDQYMHDAIDVVNNITNQKINNTLSFSNDRFPYNSEFLVTGCVSNNDITPNVFRITVDRDFVNSIEFYGETYNLLSSEVGVWIRTGAQCTAILKNNYDPVTKTLSLRINNSTRNTRYKAYQDRYSFQFATIAESQLYSVVDYAKIYSLRNGDFKDNLWLDSRYNYVSGAQ